MVHQKIINHLSRNRIFTAKRMTLVKYRYFLEKYLKTHNAHLFGKIKKTILEAKDGDFKLLTIFMKVFVMFQTL
jgi:hypothetical protein